MKTKRNAKNPVETYITGGDYPNFYLQFPIFTPKQKRVKNIQKESCEINTNLTGAGNGTRTRNLLITNQLLCQLSYTSILIRLN